MKIAIIIGTRPEIIKMAPVIDEIIKRDIDFIIIHTGQHYDFEMSNQFFLDLELPEPHYNIGVGSGSHAHQTSNMMKGIEKVLINEKPDLVMVQGDTNAVLAGSITSSKLHIPVGHVEAGLRSFDKSMPEEINRMVADVCTQIYYAPTEKSAINLLLEGINPKHIFITGNTIVDACLRNLKIAEKKSNISHLISDSPKKLLTLTMHRAENVDNPERLSQIIQALQELDDFNIVFSIHPRTLKNLKKHNLYSQIMNKDHIKLIKPLGYLDFLCLLSQSHLIMTDSGGIQEEAITLKVPCLTLRYNTERPETVSAGGNILVGADKDKIVKNAKLISSDMYIHQKMQKVSNPYGDGNSAEKLVDYTLKELNSGNLMLRTPDDIMDSFQTKIKLIKEDIKVSDYEKLNNVLIRIVYDVKGVQFPHPNLNLKNSSILYDDYA